jgi:peroxiredoxin
VELPDIREFVESATGQRCVVLGLSVDDPDREIAGLLKKHMVDWPQGRLPSGLDSPVLRQLSVSSIPMHFVIGRDGRLVFAGRDFNGAKAAIASSFASESKP